MIAQASASPRSAARLVFTAHSIPVAMAGAARYRAQLLDSSRLVADRLGIADGALAFQSSGQPENPWLEPDICQYLGAERARSLPAAVICPIAFVLRSHGSAVRPQTSGSLRCAATSACRSRGRPAHQTSPRVRAGSRRSQPRRPATPFRSETSSAGAAESRPAPPVLAPTSGRGF